MNPDEILQQDLKNLRAIGFDPSESSDPDLQFACKVYESYLRSGEFHHLAKFVPTDRVSIDVGANLGYYSIKLAAISKAVLSIEPVQELNWLAHALPPNCTFLNCAAGAQDEERILRIPVIAGQAQHGMATLTDRKTFGVFEYKQQNTHIVPLDKLIAEHFPNDRIGFIKLDVEGFEREVILGAAEILKRDQPNLQVEIAPDEVEETTAFFEALSYQGCFFYNREKLKIYQFEKAIHHAEPDWEEQPFGDATAQQPVDNFFFTPIQSEFPSIPF